MMLSSTVCLSQDKVCVNRDSLYTVLLNVSELKVENNYLRKKNYNQKLIIRNQDIIRVETEIKTEILTEQIELEQYNSKKKWWDGFGKGSLLGGIITTIIFISI